MDSGQGPDEGLVAGQKYFALGLKFAGGIVLFTLAGFVLDRWLGVLPLFTVIGTLAGAGLSFLSVYRELQADAEKERRSRPDAKH